jgi:hypothetical protein
MELIKYGTFGHRQERAKFVSLNRLSRIPENARVFYKKKDPRTGRWKKHCPRPIAVHAADCPISDFFLNFQLIEVRRWPSLAIAGTIQERQATSQGWVGAAGY